MKKIIYFTFLALALNAYGPMAFGQADPNVCVITESRDVSGTTGRGLSLRRAVNLANHPNVDARRCKSGILLNFERMDMTNMLVLQFVTANEGSQYTFGGSPDRAPVVLDFSRLPASADNLQYCDFIVKNSTNLKIQNLVIKNSQSSGICLGGTDGSNLRAVELDNVTVDGTRGHGIIIREATSDTIIRPSSKIIGTQGDAIKIFGSRIEASNKLEATNRGISGSDEFGLSILNPQDPEYNFIMRSIGSQKYVSTERNIRIRIDEVQETPPGSGKFRVRGWIVDATSEADLCTSDRVSGATEVVRIQIYSIKPDDPGFYKYVMPRSGGGGGNGFDQSGSTQGRIRFEVDKNEVGDELIVLVPELVGSSIGGSSQIVYLLDNWTTCEDGVPGPGGGGGGDGFSTIGGDAFWGFGECDAERQTGTGIRDPNQVDGDLDSDGDGLADILEDSNGNCVPDEADFSSWMDPDSDDDGIVDSLEVRGHDDKLFSFATIVDNPRPASTTNYQFCELVDGKDPCNADMQAEELRAGQAQSNAKDDDSDDDGLEDYIEDRIRTLNPWAPAVIKLFEYSYPCSLARHVVQGIEWGIYRWNPNIPEGGTEPAAPVRHNYDTWPTGSRPDDTILVRAACQSEAVRTGGKGGNDFNAQMDEDETDPYRANSDGDVLCDGEGPGCMEILPDGSQVTLQPGDNCPRVPNDSNDCALGCVQREDLYRVCNKNFDRACANRYLTFNDSVDENNPTSLKDENANGKPDLFELADWRDLYNICDSLDGDAIPDCVERMNPSCNPVLESGGELSPYKADTDNDLVPDHLDPNPFSDTVSELTPDNRESLRTVLRQAQVGFLRCFVDRDQDGLTDCQEDIDMSDSYQSREGLSLEQFFAAIAPVWTIESDPLNPDSDGDLLLDNVERDVQTNPTSRDTDGDRLSDRTEIRGSERDSYEDLSGSGCLSITPIAPGEDSMANSFIGSALRTGTNPTSRDTDDDGVEDNIEITGTSVGPVSVEELMANILEGIDVISNPLAEDSDGDGLADGAEYGDDGIMKHQDSNPCDENTDDDSFEDGDEREVGGCATINDERCEPGEAGRDFDSDGLSDFIEAMLGTDPQDPDSDNDGLIDGEEDVVEPFGEIQTHLGDTDPLDEDTDDDGLRDGVEVRFGTYPNQVDSDQDCISDGVEVNFRETSSFTGTDTNPTSPDTDGDGLCDGNNSQTAGGLTGDVTCIRGEDLNCNGVVDMNPLNPNLFAETDPRIADSDQDGIPDKTEICAGGQCNFAANIGHATRGAPGGCFSLSPVAPLEASSMLYVYGLLLMLNRVVRQKLSKK